jgi:mono/diheme cytochrome c family protein
MTLQPVPLRGPGLALGLLAAALALGLAFGLSAALRVAEARRSHQQATPEDWLGPSPAASPALTRGGRALYLSNCAHCHAADATGDEGPDLHALQVSDRYIATMITRGIKGEMPSFAKKLGAADIDALAAYLRTLD